eukprot:m.217264 g.217264  ORF g.217264 m.217264 type:complete len:499 (+) comp19119_c0_seq1:332-1828(+)
MSSYKLAAVAVTVLLSTKADAHGILTIPISRALRAATNATKTGVQYSGQCPDHTCEWYTQWTTIPDDQPVTNCDPKYRTMGVNCSSKAPGITDWPCSKGLAVPWCAPGTAPVISSCGVFSGGYDQNSRDMLDLDGTPQASWAAGSIQEVGWAITANHGGGYAYRLCPLDSNLSEDCFQKHHLKFAGTLQRVLNSNGTEVTTLNATRLSEGTWPVGSEWTRNPFPQESNLRPRIPGMPNVYGRGPFAYTLVDQVNVPADLAPGPYVLSFRWDAEQTKQVWQHCSDVLITHSDGSMPAVASAMGPGDHSKPQDVCTGTSIGLDVADCKAWVNIYDTMGGDNWPASWAMGCDSIRTDPCGCSSSPWEKNVVCAWERDYGHITELYLLGEYVTGSIPESFTGLKHLTSLSLVGTNLTGSLPQSMGDMTALNMIWLDHNEFFGGELPMSMTKLNISVLELHRAPFNGVLPPLNFRAIPDCTLNELVFKCPLPAGAETCGASCV